MPSDPTAEQVEIRRKGRQRLIGAVALALLAVVFVPMFLDPEPRQQRVEPLLAIPPKEGAAPLVPVAPASSPATPGKAESGPAGAAVESKARSPVASPPAAVEARKSVEPKAAELKSPAARPPAKPPEPRKPEAATAPRLEGFAVQVGAFREEDKLAQARDKLTAARLSHYTERLQTTSGELTRLRAGPYPTREAAEKAAAEMKRAGIEGRVVPLP